MWWQATVEWSATSDRPPEDVADEFLDELVMFHVGAFSCVGPGRFGTTISVQAPTLRAATDQATRAVVAAASKAGHREIFLLEVAVIDEETGHARLDEPLFPEMLGYSQIARLAGVSRQRIRQLAKEHPQFPGPFLETEYGPLFHKDAVTLFLQKTRWSGRRRSRGGPVERRRSPQHVPGRTGANV